MNHLKLLVLIVFLHYSFCCIAQDTIPVKNVEAILYTGSGLNQPLIVALGGSEGGNAWASNRWKKTRDAFIEKGYAFLAIGYFGCAGTPALLDRIAIDEVHQAMVIASTYKKIRPTGIAVIGGSRGADLALLMASYYSDISCVVAMSASHAVFPGNTQTLDHSSWSFNRKELPFIPVNEAAIPFLIKKDLRGAFQTMMKDTLAEKQALINIEKMKGAVLLMAGRNDEIIPAAQMAEKMVSRLKENKFAFPYELKLYEGMHGAPMEYFSDVFTFLEHHYPVQQ